MEKYNNMMQGCWHSSTTSHPHHKRSQRGHQRLSQSIVHRAKSVCAAARLGSPSPAPSCPILMF
ncbi:hypothetical protein BD309DRAFT_947375 [Dichomitus squalens]|uniref:Uncharacterized protein n=1 Tax=Dichomitus squalens TaxID=114155 RepID=A0A4Q9N4N1_9APHY|nr:hypothetical protein BD311DRAFT_747930 [Dichomitus squalens]TBU49476.1 hypothetical protein BD309DRAFT_947375 [Dichomitus squalens]